MKYYLHLNIGIVGLTSVVYILYDRILEIGSAIIVSKTL